tara:strand:- start:98 stop:247 length:150 start_codon:yes stop_codon:yes gene_type:complete
MQECVKCDSGIIKTEIMFRVAGQEGKIPEEIEVSKCEGCGNQWSKVITS